MSNLTTKQEALCQAYVKLRSRPDAYREVYGEDGTRTPKQLLKAATLAMKARGMQERIDELVAEGTADLNFTLQEAVKKFLAIAFADVNELVSVRVGACRHCWGKAHLRQYTGPEYMDMFAQCEAAGLGLPSPCGGTDYDVNAQPNPDCPQCGGDGLSRDVIADTTTLSAAGRALYGGMKRTKDGLQILIADQQKALENACRLMGYFTDNVKLGGEIKTMSQVVSMTATDPQEASRMYMDMIAGGVR